jgi:hypothetical protein
MPTPKRLAINVRVAAGLQQSFSWCTDAAHRGAIFDRIKHAETHDDMLKALCEACTALIRAIKTENPTL